MENEDGRRADADGLFSPGGGRTCNHATVEEVEEEEER